MNLGECGGEVVLGPSPSEYSSRSEEGVDEEEWCKETEAIFPANLADATANLGD